MKQQPNTGEVLSRNFVRSIRHPKEKTFFVISLITILIFGLIFVGTFFRKEIYDGVKAEVITEYQNSLSESEKQNIRAMDEATILEKISADDKELLDFLDSYYY